MKEADDNWNKGIKKRRKEMNQTLNATIKQKGNEIELERRKWSDERNLYALWINCKCNPQSFRENCSKN